MTKYHLNNQGNPGVCSAKENNCPFGDADSHFPTKWEAMKHYEENSSKIIPKVSAPHKWALVRYSDIADKYYIDRTFANINSAEKKLAELNTKAHHSATYSIMTVIEANKLVK